ncbi:glycoside hydrolase family 10 protein [Nocardiopsis sp. FIRDI 009]|uniref:glycoside hydrolase family 10 protein n=1 Tax=Nocardiopsis sp. FIRDI 009 TaxID=714197 RepID=UPI000E27CB08|nr:family 10 glycosylhydrolase [Nocardiopsis sp. FIRDI 009]
MTRPTRDRPAPEGTAARTRAPRTLLLSGALAAALTAVPLHAPPAAADPGYGHRNGPAECAADPLAPPKREMRAEWIASVVNIDWPSEQGLTAEEQRAELVELYDEARANGLNAVFVQIRPTADAFWPSPYEPWSEWLTGEQGRDPGYDPLEFAVEEAHARNLEFHGWFNPYRVAMHDDPDRLVEDHPARRNPDWVFDYGGRLYYDPGVPEVREFVIRAMTHAVENYDLDGVHFDDYFYPYPVSGRAIPDQDTFAEYGGAYDDIGDWRRDNVNRLVREMGEAVHAVKPHVRFGISPFGIWRNSSSDPDGSDTRGFESYDAIYADSRRWVREGWLDYVNPQVYWEIGLPIADYAVLVPWWEEVTAGTGTHLYIGQAAYKVGNDGSWSDPRELARHVELNRERSGVHGDVYFSATSLRTNAADAMAVLAREHYAHPALIPVTPGRGGRAPGRPLLVEARETDGEVRLTVLAGRGQDPAYYAVYALDGQDGRRPDPCLLADPRSMVTTVRASGGRETVLTVPGGGEHTYLVTALDRLHHESQPSNPRRLP